MNTLPPPLPIGMVGIIGLGDQGAPIARNILKHRLPLRFYARRDAVRTEFTALGAQCLEPVELARKSDVLLIVVVDDEQVNSLLLEDGLLGAMRPGSTVVIHSTIAPDTCRALAERGEAVGVHVLDAPVSGGRARSCSGDLTIMVGGSPNAYAAVKPVLDTYGSLVVRMGPAGAGQVAKIVNNYFYAAHLATAAKEIELVRKLGLDIEAAARVLPTCSGASAAFSMQAMTGFARTRHDKGAAYAMEILGDVVNLARNLAAEAGVDLSLIDRIVDRGMADEAAREGAEG